MVLSNSITFAIHIKAKRIAKVNAFCEYCYFPQQEHYYFYYPQH